jgi:hypothetical protein
MKFIILVSNLKKISPTVFSWKKEYIKKLRCNSTVKIWFGRKKILNYACWILLFVSFSYTIRQCFCSPTIRFVPYAFFINKQFRTCANAFPNEFTVRSYEYCAGKHWILYWIQKIKQKCISFVLGYLHMILWKISTAISIKHRILATFNVKKKFNSDSLSAFN